MKIALLSYEYPPDTADGGIATYVHQAARMMHARGHYVEVFAASRHRCGTENADGFPVHRTDVGKEQGFSECIGQVFAERHRAVGFDVLEGPEYGADARGAVRLVPDIPLVVKLHTPTFMVQRMNFSRMSPAVRARFYVGALRRRIPPPWHPENGGERLHALDADEIAAPSHTVGEIVGKIWRLDPAKVAHVPYPYIPAPDLLHIPAESNTRVVTFLGRLEVRKGVLDLARAIPHVLRRHPDTRFRFIGRPMSSPRADLNMRQYLKRVLAPYADAVTFPDPVPLDGVPTVLAETDICVFPSLWESFGLVCAEAMAAARGIVVTEGTGMAELLNQGEVGRTVTAQRPRKIAAAVNGLLDDPDARMRLGQAARERILAEYGVTRIAGLQEASYSRAIGRRQTLGAHRSRPR